MSNIAEKPALFGLRHSNRDFSKKSSWGKNQFNSSFPAALACYMAHNNLDPVYLTLNSNMKLSHNALAFEKVFGYTYQNEDLYFAFERDFTPYQQFVVGSLPRIDLVTMDMKTGICLQCLEIKLTALPDNTTCEMSEQLYGTELVIRPDTIVYLALRILSAYKGNQAELLELLQPVCYPIRDWTDEREILNHLPSLLQTIDIVAMANMNRQKPLVLQPIWKTIGKSAMLDQQCLDLFVWSDWAFTRLFIDLTKEAVAKKRHIISRHSRTTIWLIKMLYDFAQHGVIEYSSIIDTMTYNTKNDKAFAVSGIVTNRYMQHEILTKPRVTKNDIKHIILNGGHKLLSPERRFDAIIFNSPDLFDNES